ncbi:hypothetical protein SPRG_14073 [Saprolegnia parasitica CBS 223.65]|uniref:Peptidase C1A papain C-terminal domain-containing protein n=1 Tax=Saprolegnia parasitica (strain CBS 223.65) TaxID=695850 RepID=A0A067C214_SAPPC|nr:hypothetical protein SPRG_14073 [Saprolegnia parasitica CBS 223.65]KDO20842.1 hypothetical protein SPRG_14073 [Saprolegnia parasitica CBS 223.65]|eukprot:XP_012208420.1 hypothetical protein SPRG_14073 [Saprolegnia parasitica CBS 223.65]
MKTACVTMALAATSAAAMQLSNDERATLATEVLAWKATEAGKVAIEQGLAKPSSNQESLDVSDDEVLRFAATKKIVDQLNIDHPEARFSTNNPFVLLTEKEFAEYVKGSFGRGQPERRLRADTVARDLTAEQAEAAGIDWSADKCNPSVKNQGNCGSCWTFSSVAVAEQAHCLATGSLLDLSEQQLVSCDSSSGEGCQGGWPWKALDYISANGICTEADYPYKSGSTGQNGQCKTSCRKTKLSIGATVNIQGESALQSALDKQTVQVIVEAGNNVWKNYQSGVVKSCPGSQSDHAVLAVGYGTLSGVNHFKIKNSWGTSWGAGGYIYLQRGVGGNGMCNVAEHPSYPKISTSPTPTSQDPTDSPSPSTKTPEPTTKSPSPTTKTPVPTTKKPNKCHGCTGCYYPDGDECYNDYDAETCQDLSWDYGTIWCGN